MKYDSKFSLVGNIKHLFKIDGTSHDEQLFNIISRTKSERDEYRERATNATEYDEGMREAMQRIARACGKTFTVDIGYEQLPELVEAVVKERDVEAAEREELAEIVDSLRHELKLAEDNAGISEIRYILHGDIQPCTVLYSDDTTTLLRLDEGDMMLETDTIEWSDSVTYRCQELLRSTGLNKINLTRVSGHLAQLVRDERILLNDDADLGDEAYFREENKPCVAAVVVPAPPPFPRGAADHNNPYVHTTPMFSETAMRSHGWTDEALVSCGHGHYAPVQHPAAEER